MIHDGMQYDPIQGQGEALVVYSVIYNGSWPRILKLRHNNTAQAKAVSFLRHSVYIGPTCTSLPDKSSDVNKDLTLKAKDNLQGQGQ